MLIDSVQNYAVLYERQHPAYSVYSRALRPLVFRVFRIFRGPPSHILPVLRGPTNSCGPANFVIGGRTDGRPHGLSS